MLQNCHNLQESTQSMLAGRGGLWSLYAFLNVDFDALHMHTGWVVKNQHVQGSLLGGREAVTKKYYSVSCM